jgi:four helix bundle protein
MKNENLDIQYGRGLSERLLEFAARCIHLTVKLRRTAVGRHIGNQLMKAATSSGANYEEACGAESKADFVHKMQIVLKELRESLYWLKLIAKCGFCPDQQLQPIMEENNELIKMVAKSVVTAKGTRCLHKLTS